MSKCVAHPRRFSGLCLGLLLFEVGFQGYVFETFVYIAGGVGEFLAALGVCPPAEIISVGRDCFDLCRYVRLYLLRAFVGFGNEEYGLTA